MGTRDTETPRKPGRPASGGPVIAGWSKTTGQVLSWCDSQWSGDSAPKQRAELYVEFGEPLHLIPGGPPVTPEDGPLIYAVAVIEAIIGPVHYTEPPPDDILGSNDMIVPLGAVI